MPIAIDRYHFGLGCDAGREMEHRDKSVNQLPYLLLWKMNNCIILSSNLSLTL